MKNAKIAYSKGTESVKKVVVMWLLCGCYVVSMLLLWAYYVVAMWLLCDCYVVALRLLCGYYVVAMWLLCNC